jgi:adenylosuccinate lyase
MQPLSPYTALGPLDGRYAKKTADLRQFFSEEALMRYRIQVELRYFFALSTHPQLPITPVTDGERSLCASLFENIDMAAIKTIEDGDKAKGLVGTKHDVKACEYYICRLLEVSSLADRLSWIHFGLTSEDVNNVAYALMLSDSLGQCIIPAIEGVLDAIRVFAEKYRGLHMLARTHGQLATPTTLGKEFAVFGERLERQLSQLREVEISAKLNGASGNWNAHYAAYPISFGVDWATFSLDFIAAFNTPDRLVELRWNEATTQIEPHDTYAELFDIVRRINTILIDFCQDVWRYISDDWIVQKSVAGEVGSSTMPHKVNPIDFENAEGNLGLANALFDFFSRKLPISRLQRDLSDSTVERNFGVAFGHSLLAYKSILAGLGKIHANEPKITAVLQAHPEVIAEGIQTILRREGITGAYDQLKALTRGRPATMEDFHVFIGGLPVSPEVKEELLALTPETYIGLAEQF